MTTLANMNVRLGINNQPLTRGLTDTELRMRGFVRDTEGRLRTLSGRFASTSERIALGLQDVNQQGERTGGMLRRIVGMLGGLGAIAGRFGMIAGAVGSVVPLLAGVLGTLVNILPAAGLAATAILGVVSAFAALKIGLSGVGEAISGAFAAENAEQLEEALKGLSPNARSFVMELRGMKGAFNDLKMDVQDELFRDLDGILAQTAKATLPVFRKSLLNSASTLGGMASEAMLTAKTLSKNGTFGTALQGADDMLRGFTGVPALVVQAFGQIAAAAAPAMSRLSGGIADTVASWSESLDKAFASGAMTDAIEGAIDLIKQLGVIGGNIGSVLGSIFGAADAGGGGFLVTLEEISGALADAFASPEVQGGLSELFKTMGHIAKTVAPLLGQALKIIAPILAELGPPVRTLVTALGDALKPVLEELGEPLSALAQVFGAIMLAIAPLVGPLSTLAIALLPSLTPVLLSLVPLIESLGEVLLALMPILVPLMELFGELVAIFADDLALTITTVVVPAVQMIAALLRGDFSTALEHGKQMVRGMVDSVVRWFSELPGKVWDALMNFSNKLYDRMEQGKTKMRESAQKAVREAADDIGKLPGKAKAALGDLGSTLWNAGSRLVGGFIDGIKSRIGGVKSTLQDLTSKLTSWKGPESLDKKILTPAGEFVMGGFLDGILATIPAIRSALGGFTAELPDMTANVRGVSATPRRTAGSGSRVVFDVTGADEGFKRLIREMVRLDGGGDVQAAFGEL